MFNALFFSNPFEPQTHVHRQGTAGQTIAQYLRSIYGPRFYYFERPTLVLHNQEPVMFAEWETRKLQSGDNIVFTTLPGWEVVIYIIIAIVAAVVAYALTPTPEIPGQTPAPDPTYTVKGQTNQLRIMEPIEVVYGRCHIYPSYAARPYGLYDGNENYLFNLFCLGQGEFEIEGVYIEDTPIENFQESLYEVYGPGETIDLFPDNVITSVEVGNIELFGPNSPSYPPPDGWSGPFVANAAGTKAFRLEFDITFPSGLGASYEGSIINQTVQIEFERRLIDDAGAALGGWVNMGVTTFTDNTTTPQRFTLGYEVDAGRYEVRGRRITATNNQASVFKDSFWEAMRAFLPSTKTYGNVTMVAVKIKASNNLNENTRSRTKVIATRKLPIWDVSLNDGAGGWTEPQATRSIIWAFCDIMRATYGARLADEYLDMPNLIAAHAAYTVQGREFDWIFDQPITVWEAAKAVARCGRGVPMLFGSLVGLVRDRIKTVPRAVFTPENMVKDSFTLSRQLWEPDAIDHVIIEYVSPDTWKQETVRCTIPGLPQENGENIKLAGCTDRTWAFREGMYIMEGKRLWRQALTFKTGLEGRIPAYGDLIQVSHDVPKWGQPGTVHKFEVSEVWQSGPLGYFPNMKLWPAGEANGRIRISTDGTNIIPETGLWGTIFWNGDAWELERYEDFNLTGNYVDYTDVASPELVPAFGLTKSTVDLAFLSRDINWGEDWVTFYIMFRNRYGGCSGYLPVAQAMSPSVVIVTFPEDFDFDLILFDDNAEPVIFYIGISNYQQGLFQVTGITPSPDDTVEIKATNYTDSVFSHDAEIPEALTPPKMPPQLETLPTISGLKVSRPKGVLGTYQVKVSWNPSPGAKHYIVQLSNNGAKWGRTRTVTNPAATMQFQEAQMLYIRVAAVGTATGPFLTWSGMVAQADDVPGSPLELVLATWNGAALTVQWQPGSNAFLYRVRVYFGVTLLRTVDADTTSYAYTLAEATADGGPHRDYTITVTSVNSAGESIPATLDVHNDIPTAPTGLASSLDSGTTYNCIWVQSPPSDFRYYRVYKDVVSGFTPGPGNMVYEGTAHGTQITTGGVPTYWRVSAMDVWGLDEAMSAEAVIP